VLLTSRIAAREYVSERFNEIEIAEFTPEQQAHFARHWFSARGYPAKVEPFLQGLQANSRLRELATSPLLLTMICLYFEDHQDLEVSRADLYRKGLDTILERWDASREIRREESPYGRLSTSARESLYAVIALRHFEQGEVVFPAPEVRKFFSEKVENLAAARAGDLLVLSSDLPGISGRAAFC
jgi:predicted NACHT family NTPase